MKFEKEIDDLSRIVIPKNIMKKLGWTPRGKISFTIKGKNLILNQTQDKCIFCFSKNNLVEYNDYYVCLNCINWLQMKAEKEVLK